MQSTGDEAEKKRKAEGLALIKMKTRRLGQSSSNESQAEPTEEAVLLAPTGYFNVWDSYTCEEKLELLLNVRRDLAKDNFVCPHCGEVEESQE